MSEAGKAVIYFPQTNTLGTIEGGAPPQFSTDEHGSLYLTIDNPKTKDVPKELHKYDKIYVYYVGAL